MEMESSTYMVHEAIRDGKINIVRNLIDSVPYDDCHNLRKVAIEYRRSDAVMLIDERLDSRRHDPVVMIDEQLSRLCCVIL